MPLSDIIIVLSRPAEAGNVGAVCRAMKNMGLSRLRLVAPEFSLESANELSEDEQATPGFLLSEAGLGYGGNEAIIRARAVNAFDVWEQAEIFDTLAAAIKDCALVIGTTCRRGRYRKQVTMTPEETAAFLKGSDGLNPGKAALVVTSVTALAWKRLNSAISLRIFLRAKFSLPLTFPTPCRFMLTSCSRLWGIMMPLKGSGFLWIRRL